MRKEPCASGRGGGYRLEPPLEPGTESTPPAESRWPSLADWDRHRHEIVTLYTAGNKTLKEVAQYMSKKYQFHATLRMYKRRLAQWNIQKNVKADEVLAILSNKTYSNDRSHDAGDTTRPQVVTVNGRAVPISKVEQYLERRRRQLLALRKKNTQLEFCEAGRVYYYTATASSSVHAPFRGPDHLQLPEEMGRLIQQYVDGSFSAGAWMTGRHRDELRSVRSVSDNSSSSSNSSSSVVALFSNLFDGCSRLRQGDSAAGFRKIHENLDQMDRALAAEDPRFLASTFRVLAVCHWYNLPDIYRVLLTHLRRLSGIVLGPGHPATRVFALLSSMPPGEREWGVRVAAEQLCRRVGSHAERARNSGAHLDLVVGYIDTIESLGMYEESTQSIVEAVRYPDPRFRWSAETLRLYFDFVRRPSGGGRPPGAESEATTKSSTAYPTPKFVLMEDGQLGIEGRGAGLDGSTDVAVEIMTHLYQQRAAALRKGRKETMTKGGASMWPSLITCPDVERRRILKDLLASRELKVEGPLDPEGMLSSIPCDVWFRVCGRMHISSNGY